MNPPPHYDMAPIVVRMRGQSVSEYAKSLGFCSRSLWRWLRAGVPQWSADKLAVALGLTPELLWPEWPDAQGSPEITDWTALHQRESREAHLMEATRRAEARATIAASPDTSEPLRDPYSFDFGRRSVSLLATVPLSEHQRHVDSPHHWHADGLYLGPAVFIPPTKENCSCACSHIDDLGRPVTIGWCGPDCERRPS